VISGTAMAADPILLGAAAATVAIVVVYKVRQRNARPARTRGTSARTRGSSGRIPRRSWLVKAWNSSGAGKIDSDDLHGASAELTGRTLGAAGRRGKRRWTVIKTAAERSRARREKAWETSERPLVMIRRKPKPAPPQADDKPSQPEASPSPKSAPGPEPPKRHLKPVPDLPRPSGDAVTATQDTPAETTVAAPGMPPDWALMIDRVRNFSPEDDAALLAFIRTEAAGFVAYAEALEAARETCVNDIGLDPAAVGGFTVVSEHISEGSERMTAQLALFSAIYGEIQATAANGTLLPYNGRWFSGAAG
jgi:hypothetical protein